MPLLQIATKPLPTVRVALTAPPTIGGIIDSLMATAAPYRKSFQDSGLSKTEPVKFFL